MRLFQFLNIYGLFKDILIKNARVFGQYRILKLHSTFRFELEYLRDKSIKNFSFENFRLKRDEKNAFEKEVDVKVAEFLNRRPPKIHYFNPKGNKKYFVNKFSKFKYKRNINFKSRNFGLYNSQFVFLDQISELITLLIILIYYIINFIIDIIGMFFH